MPLYEYRCRACGVRFERIRKFADPPLTECPECGGEVEKLVSSPAFQFKGSGWYITDYARKGESGEKAEKGDKADKADRAASGGDKDASGESKTSGGAEAGKSEAGKSEVADKPATKDSSGDSKSKDSGTKPATSSRS